MWIGCLVSFLRKVVAKIITSYATKLPYNKLLLGEWVMLINYMSGYNLKNSKLSLYAEIIRISCVYHKSYAKKLPCRSYQQQIMCPNYVHKL